MGGFDDHPLLNWEIYVVINWAGNTKFQKKKRNKIEKSHSGNGERGWRHWHLKRMRNLSTHVRTDPSCVFSCGLIKILALGIHWETRVRRVDGSVSAAGKTKRKTHCCKDPELLITRSSSLLAAGPAFTPAAARQNARAKNRKRKGPLPPISQQPHTVRLCVINNNQTRKKFPPFFPQGSFLKKNRMDKLVRQTSDSLSPLSTTAS